MPLLSPNEWSLDKCMYSKQYAVQMPSMKITNKGFTLVELLTVLVVCACLAVIVLFIWSIIGGNQWYTEQGVLRHIRVTNPEATSITSERHVLSKSIIVTRDNDGRVRTHELDTNILFNYDLKPISVSGPK
jgi:prepilin-type N-terminal cleavage/methylation domain-containing protein